MNACIMYVRTYLCMRVYVCMYVCMYVCIYVCIYMYECTYVCVYVPTYIYIRMYVRTYICLSSYSCTAFVLIFSEEHVPHISRQKYLDRAPVVLFPPQKFVQLPC